MITYSDIEQSIILGICLANTMCLIILINILKRYYKRRENEK